MNNQEYLERNLKGYEGDNFIHKEIKDLIKDHKVELIVETGTYRGGTTKRLAEFGLPVHTFEVNKEYYDKAVESFKNIANIYPKLISSPKGIDDLGRSHEEEIKTGGGKVQPKRVLFFLDAHWGEDWPLLDELTVISKWCFMARAWLLPIIVIHDFKVPSQPKLGYDSYKETELTYGYVRDKVDDIYDGFDYTVNYNSEKKAEGAMRGVCYMAPKNYKNESNGNL
jgi:hypothetical protein